MVGPNCGGLAASNPGLARYITGAIGLPFQLMVIMVRCAALRCATPCGATLAVCCAGRACCEICPWFTCWPPAVKRLVCAPHLPCVPFPCTPTLPHWRAESQVCGAELFTGSTAMVTAAYYEVRGRGRHERQAWVLSSRLASTPLLHPSAPLAPAHARPCCSLLQPTALGHPLPSPPQGKVSLRQLARQWAGSYAGNALGCALGVTLLLGSGVVSSLMPGVSAVSLAKISYPLHQTFVSGLGCWRLWSAGAPMLLRLRMGQGCPPRSLL